MSGRFHRNTQLEDDYKPGVSYYTKKELDSFFIRRMAFIEILEKIAGGVPLTQIVGIEVIGIRASELQPTSYFEVSGGTMKAIEYPKGADITSNKIDGYKELLGITRFGFLSLALFLADEGQGHIKKCPSCEKFFLARDTKRKICYATKCSKEYHRKDMRLRRETDPVRYC